MRQLATDQRQDSLKNWHLRPNPRAGNAAYFAWNSSSTAVGLLTDIVGFDGRPGVRMTRQDVTALALYNARGASSLWHTDIGNLVEGDVWTVVYNLRSNVAMMVTLGFGYGSGSAAHSASESTVLVPNVGVTIRKKITITAAMVAQGNMFLKWSPVTTGSAVGDWFEVSSVAVVRGDYDGPFFDGASLDGSWENGTANSSRSSVWLPALGTLYNEAPKPIPKASFDWSYRSSAGNTLARTVETGGPAGASFQRLVLSAVGGTWWRHTMPTQPIDPTKLLEVSADLRFEIANVAYSVIFRWFDATNTFMSESSVFGTSGLANTWDRYYRNIQPPANARFVAVEYSRSAGDVGATFDATRLVFGSAASGVYSDGDTPGWRWEGTPGYSASRGLPWTLESIVGHNRIAAVTGVGANAEGRPIGAFEDRGIYAIYDVIATAAVSQILAVHGAGTGSGIRLQALNTSQNAMGTRADFKNGTSNVAQTLSNARTIGRRASGFRTRFGVTQLWRRSSLSAGASAVQTVTGAPFDGMPTVMDFYTDTNASNFVQIQAYVIAGDIDDDKDAQILRWFANKYALAA